MVGFGGWGFQEQGWRKGPWTTEEDKLLTEYVTAHGEGRWSTVAKSAGLNRNSKSCRLRWVNYLRPGLKRGQLTAEEENTIKEMHALWGNKWSLIARCLPGRTDNEIKNYWRTHFKVKTKNPRADENPRARTWRSLRQQKELGQQYKQQQQQQQPQIADIKCHLEQCDNLMTPEQAAEQMHFMFPNMEEQCFATVAQNGASSSDGGVGGGEEALWGSLWNMDDLNIQFNQIYDNYKSTKPGP